MLISVSGIDCSGKSTQIALLENALRSRGERVSVMWFRPGYSRELNWLRAVGRRLAPGALPKADQPGQRAQVFAKEGVARSWVGLALADTLVQYAVKLRGPLLMGRAAIVDRYLDDGLLDLQLRFPQLRVEQWPLYRCVEALTPKPDRAFLLNLPYAEMIKRMEAKREPFPDTAEVRDRRFAGYERLARCGRFEVIDANRPPDVVHADIVGRLPA